MKRNYPITTGGEPEMEENEIFTQEQIDKINEIVKTAFAEAAKGLAEHETAIEERVGTYEKRAGSSSGSRTRKINR